MLYLGADHRGYNLKEKIKNWLESQNIKFEDLGAQEMIPEDDYPDYAKKVAEAVIKNLGENKGILICGSGVGVCVVANKFRGARCGLVFSKEMAQAAKADDDINILALASDFIKEENVLEIINAWLKTSFKNEEKYIRRLQKIEKIENDHYRK
jgi:ribose 5-phosphate isomerase B